MKRKRVLLILFSAIMTSLLPLASFFVRNAYCRLNNPIVNVNPAEADVGQEVSVEATINVVSG